MSDAKGAFEKLQDAEAALDAAREKRREAIEAKQAIDEQLAAAKGSADAIDSEHDAVDARRAEAETALAEAQLAQADAEQNAKDAKKAFEDAAKTELLPKIRNLYREMHAANDRLEAAMQALAGAQQRLADILALRKRLDAEKQRLAKVITTHARKAHAAEQKVKKTEAAVSNAKDDVDDARRDLADELDAEPPNDAQKRFIDLLAAEGAGKFVDYLTIRTRNINYDDLVREAFVELDQHYLKVVKPAELKDELLKAGFATNMGKVTKKLNRRRLKDIRRELLARSYPALILNRLGGNIHTIEKFAEAAEDVDGFADTVAHDLQSKAEGSVRDTFSECMTKIVVDRMNIDAPAGSIEREIIKAKICAAT